MRFKNRYLLLQLVWQDGKKDEALSASIWNGEVDMHG